jgi:hypothetical protein
MVGIVSLWLPILLAALIVFFVSAALHMGPFWHRGDYPRLPREEEVLNALAPLGIPPGDYMLPRASSMAQYKTAEFAAKLERGPVALITVLPNGRSSMGRSMGQWFVFLLVVGVMVAYLTGRTLPPGTSFARVLQIGSATAFIAYVVALAEMSIWYRRGWGLVLKSALDGVIYAFATGAVFAWLWPH